MIKNFHNFFLGTLLRLFKPVSKILLHFVVLLELLANIPGNESWIEAGNFDPTS